MNRFTNVLLGGILIALSPAALAQDSADLIVSGRISPDACIATMTGAGSFDLGSITSVSLNEDAQTNFNGAVQQLAITCPAATLLALRLTDARADSASLNLGAHLGLGRTRAGEAIGFAQYNLANAVVDGAAAGITFSANGGATWGRTFASLNPYINVNRLNSFADPADYTTPLPITTLNARVWPTVRIQPAQELTLTDEVNIDASATLELIYL